MLSLAEAYREGRRVNGGDDGGAEHLEAALARCHERGRARHPEIALSEVEFARHIARCGAPVWAGPDGVNAEDLFIACAALAGDGAAVAKMRREYWPIVARYVGHIRTSGTWIADLEQNLWSALLVGDVSRPPKLASYSGSGSLAGFIGVSAQRMALRSLGHEDAVARAAARAAAQVTTLAADAEVDFAKQHYRDEFERAIRAALEVLDDRQRMILRMQVVDGLTVDRIAKVYNVSQSTVSRWLEKARVTVLQRARRAMGEIVSLTESEFNWLVDVMTSQLDISVSGVLRSG
jgi:RNA polymerase sigma-70 factor, ECF subfamily